MARTIAEIEEEAVARIVALSATPYVITGLPSTVWHETTVPLDQLLSDSNALSHLLFEVAIVETPNTDAERDNEVDGQMEIGAVMLVSFLFALRATRQKADVRLASDAAHSILRKLMGVWNFDATGVHTVLCDEPYRPSLTSDGTFVYVEQRYRVLAVLDISTP